MKRIEVRAHDSITNYEFDAASMERSVTGKIAKAFFAFVLIKNSKKPYLKFFNVSYSAAYIVSKNKI